MNLYLRHAVISLSLALMAACAQLPEYAQPRKVQFDEPQSTRPNGFPYRALQIEDFRAASVPEQLSVHAERIDAHSAVQIRLNADSSFSITHGDLFGQSYFFGRIERLGFEAILLPDRSWWNPQIPADMRGYVLQHEQIHFALTELAARQLTSDSPKWAFDVLAPPPDKLRIASSGSGFEQLG